jgi:hypothetical protein
MAALCPRSPRTGAVNASGTYNFYPQNPEDKLEREKLLEEMRERAKKKKGSRGV